MERSIIVITSRKRNDRGRYMPGCLVIPLLRDALWICHYRYFFCGRLSICSAERKFEMIPPLPWCFITQFPKSIRPGIGILGFYTKEVQWLVWVRSLWGGFVRVKWIASVSESFASYLMMYLVCLVFFLRSNNCTFLQIITIRVSMRKRKN